MLSCESNYHWTNTIASRSPYIMEAVNDISYCVVLTSKQLIISAATLDMAGIESFRIFLKTVE
ncbi:MAG: hypothetical protein ACFC1C_00620 [Candidatus Malihini olakiniferum]